MMFFIAGIAAGLLHVVSGPDHLAAIAPIALRRPQRAWLTGVRWGFGHASGVCFVGVLSLLLRGLLPVDLISDWSDRIVGILLIGVGIWAFRKAFQVHAHEHDHYGEKHVHLHVHGKRKAHTAPTAHAHTHAAFGIGTLHGLSGSSHFLAIIPALAAPSKTMAALYLACYGVGTMLAMALFAQGIGMVSVEFNTDKLYRRMMLACSGLAMVVGVLWVSGYSW
jgi:sulfite exporter TauE/SafE